MWKTIADSSERPKCLYTTFPPKICYATRTRKIKQSFQMAYLATARITPEVTRRRPIICLAEYVLPKSRAEKISCHTRNDCSINS